VAFPVTFWFFADGFAFWLRSLAMSYTMRSFANSDAFRTIEHFTSFIRAFDFTFWLFTLDIANGIFWFSARSVALGRLANWIAYSWAVRVVALPRALWMALSFT